MWRTVWAREDAGLDFQARPGPARIGPARRGPAQPGPLPSLICTLSQKNKTLSQFQNSRKITALAVPSPMRALAPARAAPLRLEDALQFGRNQLPFGFALAVALHR